MGITSTSGDKLHRYDFSRFRRRRQLRLDAYSLRQKLAYFQDYTPTTGRPQLELRPRGKRRAESDVRCPSLAATIDAYRH